MVSFTVNVIDNGESGTTDVFSIDLNDGYSSSGPPTRRNVQVHE
jgi:hypothetical protein